MIKRQAVKGRRRTRSWAEADETLRQWAQTVPEGSTHRVA